MAKIIFEFSESPETFVKEVGIQGIPVHVNVSVEGFNRDKPGHAEHLIAIMRGAATEIIKATNDLYLEKLNASGYFDAKSEFYQPTVKTH